MRGVGEEIEGFDSFEVVFCEEEFDVAGLGGGVAGEIDDFFWNYFEEFIN